jgi:hypothetical protein
MKTSLKKSVLAISPKVLLLVLIIGALSACRVNNVEPLTAITDATAFNTATRCELAVAGMYDSGQTGFYDTGGGGGNTGARGYAFNGPGFHMREMRGEDAVNTQIFYLIVYANSQTSSSPNPVGIWNNCYALINIANIVIDGVRTAGANGVIPAANTPNGQNAASYEGEARFLRALAHFELLIHFARPFNHTIDGSHAGVPIRNTAISSGSTVEAARLVPRSTVAAVYDFILQDLDFAEANLIVTRVGVPAVQNVTRADRAAAIALKQRIKMHRYDWAGAIAEGNKLISATNPVNGLIGGISLPPSPDAAFVDNVNSGESIFSIENNAQDNPGGNGSLPQFQAPGSRELICMSPNLFNATWWLATDTRRTLLTGRGSAPANRVFSRKYRDIANSSDFAPHIRYAEVLLNQAESIVQSTNSIDPTAVTLLNAVRNRGVGVANAFSVSSFASASDLMQAISRERRIELAGEGDRWRFIHRYSSTTGDGTLVRVSFPERPNGVPAKIDPSQCANAAAFNFGNPFIIGSAAPALPYSSDRFIWPIPNIELINNPIVVQNPGY